MTTAVVAATVGGYSSCLLRMTADEGGVGDDTCLTSGWMCTCVLSPSSASIDPYFHLPFLIPATHFDIFLKRWLIFTVFSLPLTSVHTTPVFIILISSLSSSEPYIFHAIICSFMPSLSQLQPVPCAPLLHQHLPAGSERRLYPPMS